MDRTPSWPRGWPSPDGCQTFAGPEGSQLARRIYLRRTRQPTEVNVLGNRMRLDPVETVDAGLLFSSQLPDRTEMRFLRENLCARDLFLDAGYSIGR
ncbi:MAG TPA: hypothetical protein VG815_14710 [Chloroflexota bacterium]|nr:hypothetical protein [Chloroflexota bacterium]